MWHDLTQAIQERHKSEDDLSLSSAILFKHMRQIHPLSLAPVVAAVSSNLPHSQAVSLLGSAISAIQQCNIVGDGYDDEIVFLLLCQSIAHVKGGILENIEPQIVSLASNRLSERNKVLHCWAAALYYEAVGNCEEAQHYLLQHALLSGKVQDIEKLVRLSILSSRFFDFATISAFQEFVSSENTPLMRFFVDFQNGDIAGYDSRSIQEMLCIEQTKQIQDKMNLVCIIRACFRSQAKLVTFDALQAELGVDETLLVGLLLRALGLRVVKGWIDSEQRIFFFDSVLPHALCSDEISEMKKRFVEWKARVESVIEVIESAKLH